MNVKGRYIPAAVGLTVLVTGLLVGAPLLLAHRLPDPVASHWGPSGAPDGSMPRALMTLPNLVIWLVIAGGVLAAMIWSTALLRRRSRAAMGAMLLGGGVFTLAMTGHIIYANLDRTDWRQAAHVGLEVPLVFVLAGLAAWAGALLARPGPDEPPARTPRPSLEYPPRPGEHAVWVSSLTVPWAVMGGSGFLVAGVAFAAVNGLAGIGGMGVVFAFVGIIGLVLSTIRVQVDRRGLAIAFGPLRWPVRRIPLSRIDGAWVETRHPSDVGGWGYRGTPGGTTVMLRGGECLVVRYVSGGEFAVTTDDAERGAALLNELINQSADDRS